MRFFDAGTRRERLRLPLAQGLKKTSWESLIIYFLTRGEVGGFDLGGSWVTVLRGGALQPGSELFGHDVVTCGIIQNARVVLHRES